jgi:uncharacterized protein
MRTLLTALLITLFTSMVSLNAASFDCSKATTETEIAICKDPALSKLDVLMQSIFSASLKDSMDPKKLRQKQQNWIEERDLCLSDIICIKRNYRFQVSQTWSKNCSEKVLMPSKLIDKAYRHYGTAYSGGEHLKAL